MRQPQHLKLSRRFLAMGVCVIDIDSPVPARFDEEDEAGMRLLAETLREFINF